MTTWDETEKCLLCRAVCLRVVCVRYRLGEGVLLLLAFRYVVSEVNKDGIIESLGLVVFLWMVHRAH